MPIDALKRSAWDVVIVGGGTTGAVLAARLSEDGERTVLLLEAGRDYRSADAPAEMNARFHLAALDQARVGEFQWSDLTWTNTAAQRPVPVLRGRGLGGSSAINGRGAIRAPMDDFAAWAEVGGPQWGPGPVLESLTTLEDDLQFGDEPYHGRGGPIPISREPVESFSSVHTALVESALAVGEPWFADLNAPENLGISLQPYIGVPGKRYSTNDGYLEPARDRPNLDIVGDALVDRVLLQDGRAVGVVARIAGREVTLRAGSVIVSAGSVHSPAVLLRSGIGPATELRALGITPVADLPVGQGIQDHPSVLIALPLGDGFTPSTGEITTGVFIRTSTGVSDKDLLIFSNVPESPGDFPFALLCGLIARAESTGVLRLRSTDPLVNPEIELRMLSTGNDLSRARLALRRILELTEQAPLRNEVGGPAVPCNFAWGGGPEVDRSFDDFSTDADLDRWLVESSIAGMHVSSSCALGPVVGPDLSVHGVEGLHVADMSIAPSCPRANTLLTAIMIGEHLARLLANGVPLAAAPPGRT